ncbi:MAG: S9 family peptidase [Nitriliruptoraceae bacterium]|nr:S9 family peptidase [Nitriliruptoraceae bacterium]
MSGIDQVIATWFGRAGISGPALTPDGRKLTALGPHPVTGAATVLALDLTSTAADMRPLLPAHARDLRFQIPTRDGTGVLVVDDPEIDRSFDIAYVRWDGTRRSLVPAGLRDARPLDVPRDRPHELLIRATTPDGDRPVLAIDLRTGVPTVRQPHLAALDVVVGRDGSTAVTRVARPQGGVRLERVRLGSPIPPELLVDRIADAVEAIPWALEGHDRLWIGATVEGDTRRLCRLDVGRTTVTSVVAVDGLDVDPPLLHTSSGQVMAARVVDDLPGLVPIPVDADAPAQEHRRHRRLVEAIRATTADGRSLQHWDLAGGRELHTVCASGAAPVTVGGARDSQRGGAHRPARGADRPTGRRAGPASDGVELRSYLTTPTDHAGALVLRVHGGPWERDDASWDPLTQTCARAGIAVLRVNYRGSTGFGARHAAGAIDQFDRRVLDDLRDAVRHAVRIGIARADRVGVMGHSFGGYLSLLLATREPASVAAAISWSGPADLRASLAAMSERADRAFNGTWVRAAGDPTTAAGRARLAAASPITHVAALRAPTLIIGGLRDPRVPPATLRSFAHRARAAGADVAELLFEDEGHGIRRPANRIRAIETIVTHLRRHLLGAERQG